MEKMHNIAYLEITNLIFEAVNKTWPDLELTKDQIYASLTMAPNFKMGHVAFACFSLAKTCRMAPPQIANSINDNISSSPIVQSSKAVGPYLNFFVNLESLANTLIKEINTGIFFEKELTHNAPKTMVEYSQPNTHKVLHVGHMRNLCLGNAIVKILNYSGQETLGVTYPGDMGTHVAKCLWYLKFKNKSSLPTVNKGAWLGEIYSKANQLLEDEVGTNKEEENRKNLTEIIKGIESGKGDDYELWVKTREWSIDLMKEAYSWANVNFERWFFESEVDEDSLQLMKKLHHDNLLIEDQGAIGMNLEKDKLGFCILIKSDGTGLYSTKDVELARKKFEEYGIEKSIYIVDNRQAFHFKQVFKVLEKIGFEQAKDCFHLQYDVVDLPDGAMSSRKGNIVPLMHLIESMETKIKNDYLNKYKGEWSDEEINETARKIAGGAIKYGMIRIDNNRKIIFDMNEWLKLDGETGPYLQYVYARINSLLLKLDYDPLTKPNFAKLTHSQEESLLLKLNGFNTIVVSCAKQLKTIHLTNYLYELGKMFNSFYAECSIGNAPDEETRIARLHLTNAVGKVMKKGLSIIGIEAPDRM